MLVAFALGLMRVALQNDWGFGFWDWFQFGDFVGGSAQGFRCEPMNLAKSAGRFGSEGGRFGLTRAGFGANSAGCALDGS